MRSIPDGSAANGNGSFPFVAAAAFSGRAGELRVYQDAVQANAWFVEGDLNGDRIADLSISVFAAGGYQIGAADFVF